MFLYVANWKMCFSFNKSLEFCENNYKAFIDLSQCPEKKVILCPSFTDIAILSEFFGDSLIEIGAQDCSSNGSGPYTGQILAESLVDAGCTYCIVGHSEVRKRFNEDNNDIAKKVVRLYDCAITPILCIGEKKGQSFTEVLKGQLLPVFKKIRCNNELNQLCIAYEPVWAIGTGIVPKKDHIERVFDFILDISKKSDFLGKIILLYGGSVNSDIAEEIKSIDRLGGFLIGGASLDFKKFEKIVKL